MKFEKVISNQQRACTVILSTTNTRVILSDYYTFKNTYSNIWFTSAPNSFIVDIDIYGLSHDQFKNLFINKEYE